MKLSVTTEGDFNNTERWLDTLSKKIRSKSLLDGIDTLSEKALGNATPVGETGETSKGWRAKIITSGNGEELSVTNTAHPQESVNIAKIIELGHGTGTGGYVPPRPYIREAMQPVWKEVDKRIDKELRS